MLVKLTACTNKFIADHRTNTGKEGGQVSVHYLENIILAADIILTRY